MQLAQPPPPLPPPPSIHDAHSDPELKRKYLSLLPPTQIIDICLAFEAHAPLHIRSTLWPHDLNLAISGLQQQENSSQVPTPASVPPPLPQTPSTTTNGTAHPPPPAAIAQDKEPVMGSLAQPPPVGEKESTSDQESSSSSDTTRQASPADGEQPFVELSTPGAGPSKPISPLPPPPSSTTPSTPMPAAFTQPIAGTHFSYLPQSQYSYTQQPAYPHAPYYSLPPGAYYHYPSGYYPYSSTAPPPTPQINPQPSVPSSFYPQQPHTNTVDTFSSNGGGNNSADDLPSYEEMIVEALTNCDEGNEGCAPKSLFTWMASHYPLQTNFRPSASQALQKAYKRGRLLKSASGKYSINTAWEGGNTSRRTTRRPQTGGHMMGQHGSPPPTRSSPFTTTPLMHNTSFQNASSISTPPITAGAATTTNGEHEEEHIAEGSDAWEAAQNILKAINFQGLLAMPSEEAVDTKGTTVVMATNSATHNSTVPAPQGAGQIGREALPQVAPAEPRSDADMETYYAPAGGMDERAQLQASLIALAAQLAVVMDEDSEDEMGPAVGEDDDDEDDEDMEEVV